MLRDPFGGNEWRSDGLAIDDGFQTKYIVMINAKNGVKV